MKYRILWFIIVIPMLTGCWMSNQLDSQNHHNSGKDLSPKEVEGPYLSSLNKEITVAAIGDLLIHSRVYDDAWNGENYDFTSMLEPVAEYLEQPTITMANQESIMGGEEIGLSNYPQFNSPFELADNIKKMGIDIVTMANNHTLDRGEQAIDNAIEHYEKIDMMYTGSFKSEADKEEIRVIETTEGISVAFLSYTYGTNGIPVPNGKDYLVNMIDRKIIEKEVNKAQNSADVTIVSYHFGQEYQRTPNQEQKDLAQFTADLGVDVIVGHHPHVLQPIEWLEGKDGNQTLVAYSLGNFLSGQYELYRRIGGILEFKVSKETKGESNIKIHSPSFLPTFVSFERSGEMLSNIEVLPLKDVDDNQLSNASGYFEEMKKHLSQNVDHLKFIE
ncbi:CapA family protein [Gracilibacillus massiliensis]|uniref:CapA family protein n=1 Tax=Gracilibacillus massiliensis TaxID=1564956 RepID=UPI00071CA1AD|nr:CapA family protein [Gracilibacillus massiliensis]